MHIIGFMHTQSRPDRNEKIIINWNNIIKDQEHNFIMADSRWFKTYGPYEYSSLMHYPRTAFARERGLETITPKGGYNGVIGNTVGLTQNDIDSVNEMYKGICQSN